MIEWFQEKTKNDPVDFFLSIANNQFLGENRIMNMLQWNYRIVTSTVNKPLITSSNTWPTLHIDQNWDIVQELERNKAGILYSEVFIKQ